MLLKSRLWVQKLPEPGRFQNPSFNTVAASYSEVLWGKRAFLVVINSSRGAIVGNLVPPGFPEVTILEAAGKIISDYFFILQRALSQAINYYNPTPFHSKLTYALR